MSSMKTLKPQEIAELLSKLKAETPEYPSNLLAAKKAAFLKQAVNIKLSGKGPGGQQGGSGGSGGGSGTLLSGGSTTQGVLLQALLGFWIVVALLTTAYAFRNQITDILKGNEVAALEESSQPSIVSSPLAPPVGTPVPSLSEPDSIIPATDVDASPTGVVSGLGDTNMNGATVIQEGTPDAESASNEKDKDNPGLHLGQTPGAPAAPGLGNPGNVNQPDKPTKPDKTKPDNKPSDPPGQSGDNPGKNK